jgi:kinetochor protein Mis14/NSL1
MAMEIDTHPNPTPDLHHRKIELQSLADLTHLQTQLHAASTAKLDLHFPPSALRKAAEPATYIGLGGTLQPQPTTTNLQNDIEPETDPMRQRVQTLVDSFLQRTWESAARSISINGLDATSLPNINTLQHPQQSSTSSLAATASPRQTQDQEIEGLHFAYTSYDARLQSHLASLYGELESLTAQVSKLRREAPSSGAQQYSKALSESLKREEEAYEEEVSQLRNEKTVVGAGGSEGKKMEKEEEDGNVLKLEPVREGYHEDLRQTYEHGLRNLSMLAGTKSKTLSQAENQQGASLTETLGKVQRARTVAMEFD